MVLKNNHSVGLDLLRVVSSLLVFIPHLLISFLEKETGNLYIISSIGVELFFCLSARFVYAVLIEKFSSSIVKNESIETESL